MFAAASKTASSSAPSYIEDVFSTYLYSGNSSTQTITNGLDISGKGGLVWLKMRSNVQYHYLFDTARGPLYSLSTNTTDQSYSIGNTVTAFNSNGFNLGLNSATNGSGDTFVSWTFRKQPKFFDVVTYTGNGSNNRQIAHDLQSTPGFIVVKRTDSAGYEWTCWQRTQTGYFLFLNTTDARFADTGSNKAFDTGTPMSSTTFSVGAYSNVNANGGTYVAYLFAHDAGGFGLTGTDNVVSCGSYTGNGSTNGPTINLGYEPQWILIKRTDTSGQYWCVWDNMRGIVTGGNDPVLYPNVSDAENTGSEYLEVNATGFQLKNTFTAINASGSTYIYIAIRRGPMKTPTTGASVFEPAFATANSPEYKSNTVISGFDTALTIYRPGYSDANFSFPYTAARLTGARKILQTSRTDAEYTYSTAANFAYNTGWFDSVFGNDTNRESYMFKRAPGFHDVVAYSGTGVTAWINHNLTVPPELIILKNRTVASGWLTYAAPLGADKYLQVNSTAGSTTSTIVWDNTTPTSTQFRVYNGFNNSGYDYVGYLFASCPGVSKVGSYTGTGANQTIDCGFASGVRWVLIKRTDTTGDWYVYDTTRGMTSGTDPYILLNSTAAEVTGTNYVETIATGFRLIGSNAGTNANSGTYIYLAIA